MEAVTYSNFRKNLKHYFKQVNDDATPLIVTNKDSQDNVIVISKEDYDSIMESVQIMSNKYLFDKIQKGRNEAKKGKIKVHDLKDFSDEGSMD